MALSNAELVAQTGGGAAPKDAQKVDGSIAFKRNLFLNTENTGISVDRKKGTPNGEVSELVKISPELQKQYSRFLDNYVQNLNELIKEDADGLDAKEFAMEKQLVEHLSDAGRSSDEKISAFLQTPEGWMITTQIMEQQMARKLYALGLIATKNPSAERITDRLGNTHIVTRIDEGTVRGFVKDNIEPHLGKAAKVAGVVASSALGAFAAAKLLDSSYAPHGAISGALTPLVVNAIQSYRKEGITIDLKQSDEGIRYLQANPREAKFLAKMNNLDVNDLVGTNPIVESRNVQKVWEDILSTMYTRANFYDSLGIPVKELDAIPEQFLFNFGESDGQMEQNSARWANKVWEKFNANGRGIKDTSGRLPTDTGFDRGNIDVTKSLKELNKARREVMLGTMQEYLARSMSREAPSSTDIDVLTRRIDTISTDGAEFKKRTGEIDKDIANLQSEQASLAPTKEKVEAYQEARRKLQELHDRFTNLAPENYTLGIDQVIKLKDNKINDATDPLSIVSREAPLKPIYQADLLLAQTAASAHVAGLTKPTQDEIKGTYKIMVETGTATSKKPLDDLENERQEILTELKELKELKLEIQKQEQIIKQLVGETVIATGEKLSTFTQNLDEITRLAVPGQPSVTENDLRTKSFDQIMAMINNLYNTSPVGARVGWEENKNSDAGNIALLRHAVAEAKAREADKFDNADQVGVETITNIINGNARIPGGGVTAGTVGAPDRITDDELISLSNADLLRRLTDAATYNWDPADGVNNMKKLEAARAEARRRQMLRVGTLTNEVSNELDQKIKKKTKDKEDLKFDKETSFLKLSRDAMTRKGEIYSQTLEQMYKPDTFLNLTTATAAEGYTPAEVATAAPEGYYNIAQMLFEYQNETNREKAFNSVQQVMPPERLAAWLDTALDLKFASRGITPDITTVLQRIQALTKRNQMPPHRLYMGMNEVLRNIRNQAMAYTV